MAPAGSLAPMASFAALLDRLDRLLLRYEEAQRRQSLLESQVQALTLERDSLRSRLAAARGRIDALLDRIPSERQELSESGAAREPAAPEPAAPEPANPPAEPPAGAPTP